MESQRSICAYKVYHLKYILHNLLEVTSHLISMLDKVWIHTLTSCLGSSLAGDSCLETIRLTTPPSLTLRKIDTASLWFLPVISIPFTWGENHTTVYAKTLSITSDTLVQQVSSRSWSVIYALFYICIVGKLKHLHCASCNQHYLMRAIYLLIGQMVYSIIYWTNQREYSENSKL